MNSWIIRTLRTLAILMLLFVPASASHQLQNATIVPAAESLPAGIPVNFSATIEIIPPGPTTTFVEWDNLVLSTELSDPHWNVVAIADQHLVVVNQETGSVLNVPGYLLSYNVDRKVSVSVNLEGRVPASEERRTFIVLSVDEQNDRGVSVGDPEYVTRAIIPTAAQASAAPTTQAQMKVGLSFVPVIAAVAGILLVLGRRKD